MAIDLETGETGNPAELYLKAVARRWKRWDGYCGDGLNRVKAWTRQNPRRKVSPTRFYKLFHGAYA